MSFGQRSRGSRSASDPIAPSLELRGVSLHSPSDDGHDRSSDRERSSPRASSESRCDAGSPHSVHSSRFRQAQHRSPSSSPSNVVRRISASATSSNSPTSLTSANNPNSRRQSPSSSPSNVVRRISASATSSSGPTSLTSANNPNFRRAPPSSRAQPPSRNVVVGAMPTTELFSGRSNYPFGNFLDPENEWDRTYVSTGDDDDADADADATATATTPRTTLRRHDHRTPSRDRLHMQGDAWVSANAYDDLTDSESDDGAPHRATRGAVSRAHSRLQEQVTREEGDDDDDDAGALPEATSDDYQFERANFQDDTDDDEAAAQNDAGDNWTEDQLEAECVAYWLAHASISDPLKSVWPLSRVSWLNDCILRRHGMPLSSQRLLPTRSYASVSAGWSHESLPPLCHSSCGSSRAASREAGCSTRLSSSAPGSAGFVVGRRCPAADHLCADHNNPGNSDNDHSTQGSCGGQTSRGSSASSGDRRHRQNLADSCVVCFEGFEEHAIVVELGCRHVFHRRCMTSWLRRAVNCPVCRAGIDVQALGDEDEERRRRRGAASDIQNAARRLLTWCKGKRPGWKRERRGGEEDKHDDNYDEVVVVNSRK